MGAWRWATRRARGDDRERRRTRPRRRALAVRQQAILVLRWFCEATAPPSSPRQPDQPVHRLSLPTRGHRRARRGPTGAAQGSCWPPGPPGAHRRTPGRDTGAHRPQHRRRTPDQASTCRASPTSPPVYAITPATGSRARPPTRWRGFAGPPGTWFTSSSPRRRCGPRMGSPR
jgi:hypothetical protein